LGAVQNIVVNSTYPTIQLNPAVDLTTAGPGGTSLVGKRFRKVSGPGSADVGTLFWLEDTVDGDTSTGYVSRPQFANPPFFASNEVLATDDVYEAEDLGVMGRMEINPRDNQIINFATTTTSVSVENGKGVAEADEGQAVESVFGPADGGAGVCVHGCDVNYGRTYANFTNYQACKFGRQGGAFSQTSIYTRRLAYFTGCSIQGPTLNVGGSGGFQTYNNPSFSRCRLTIETTSSIPTILFWDAPSFREWSTVSALSLGDSHGQMRRRPWGTSTLAGTYGLYIGARGRWTYDQAPTVSGAAAFDYDIGGLQNTYVGGPLPVLNPANGAMLAEDV
jgi:hypothetical protein